MYYIYALIDSRTSLPFYVGKGKTENQRHLDHFKETESTTDNRHKFYKIQYLKNIGLEIPVVILVDGIHEESTAYLLEAEQIQKFGRKNIDENGILTNICIDKRPPSAIGRKQSKEHIEKRMKSRAITVEMFGLPPVSEETKKKKSDLFSGENNPFYEHTHSQQTKDIISKKNKGNKSRPKTFIFTSPSGINYSVVGEFVKFCIDHDLSKGTMKKILRTSVPTTYGKCAGWFVKHTGR